MDSETWMNAYKARELGFCDEVLYTNSEQEPMPDNASGFSFARKTAVACLVNRVLASTPKPQPPVSEPEPAPAPDNRIKAADLEKRLSLLK